MKNILQFRNQKKICWYIFLLIIVDIAMVGSVKASEGDTWLKVEIGIIGTASKDILRSAMSQVSEKKHSGLLIQLDTPGGALDATREMVKDMMGAQYPVVVWVGPSGSRAGSAGAFITIAGHIAAMAPGTNIGAAHPIQATGKNIDSGDAEKKILNDTVAFIESIAKTRNRNVEMARSFVAVSTSVTAEEALKNNIVDIISDDIDTLMATIHKKEISLHTGTKLTLNTIHSKVINYELSFRQKALEILSNPNFFYLLFLAGMIGLGFELTHPGAIFPGVIGGICLIMALIATSVLPVSLGAAALIIVGVACMVAEAFVPSFGVLGIGGFTAFVLGSVFLVDPSDTQGLRISWFYIAPGAVTIAAAGSLIAWLILKAENAPVDSGAEGWPGKNGVAVVGFRDGLGQVRVDGEIWQANTQLSEADHIEKGDQIIVRRLDGLSLVVVKKV